MLEKQFTDVAGGDLVQPGGAGLGRPGARDGHKDEKKFHDEAIAKLQREHKRIQDRIDAMYMDKLDGRIDAEFFDRKAAEFRAEQCRIMRDVDAHQVANNSYIKEGPAPLAKGAYDLRVDHSALKNRNILLKPC